MKATTQDRLQLGGWIRFAAALAFLAFISGVPLYTNSRAVPVPVAAPAADPEPALPASPVQVQPAEPAATQERDAVRTL